MTTEEYLAWVAVIAIAGVLVAFMLKVVYNHGYRHGVVDGACNRYIPLVRQILAEDAPDYGDDDKP